MKPRAAEDKGKRRGGGGRKEGNGVLHTSQAGSLAIAQWALLPLPYHYHYHYRFFTPPPHIHSLSSWKSPGEGGACVMRSRDKIRSYKVPTTGSNMMFIIRCQLCFLIVGGF